MRKINNFSDELASEFLSILNIANSTNTFLKQFTKEESVKWT